MIHRTIMNLSGHHLLHHSIVMDGSLSTQHEHNLAVAFMLMQSCRCSRSKDMLHYLAIVINIVAGGEQPLTTLEAVDKCSFNL